MADKTANECVEVVPLPPTPTIDFFFSIYVVTCRAIDLGVDLSGNEDLLRAWYTHNKTLPVVWHINLFLAIMALPAWLGTLFKGVRKAFRGEEPWSSTAPAIGIPLMVHYSMAEQTLVGEGEVPSPEARQHLIEIHMSLLVVASFMLLSLLAARWATLRKIRGGLRRGGHALTQEPSLDGVPVGAEVVALEEERAFEFAPQLFLYVICLIDLAVALRSDEALLTAWGRERWVLPIVGAALIATSVATCANLMLVALPKVPEALRGVRGRRAGCASLALVPALAAVCAVEGQALRVSTSVAKVVLAWLAVACPAIEVGIGNEGITEVVKVGLPQGALAQKAGKQE